VAAGLLEVMLMGMTRVGPWFETLHRTALPLVVIIACSSCGTDHVPREEADGGIGPVVVLIKLDVAENTSPDAGPDVPPMPGCCWTALPLTPVGTGEPCSFTVPGTQPDSRVLQVYLNNDLVERYDLDGGPAYYYDPTSSTVVFTGASCDTILSSPQDPVVQMVCDCWSCDPFC